MAFQADSIFWVEVEKIVPNPYQPRREFDEAKLNELAESVRMYGILQPLTVTRKEIQGDDGSFRSEYELIAGERRLRASKIAGLQLVPVIIRDGEQTEQEKLELAIIENLQREDLNAVDRALAFRQLSDVFGLSHGQVAQKVGRSREYVSNTIRLLALPDYMLSSLRTNDITEGHARTLLMLNDRPEEQDVLFREILLKKLSVREVERIARGIATDKVRKKALIDNDILEIERQFTDALGTRVSIVKTDFGGRLTIDYFSIEDLEVMLEKMRREAAATVVSAAYKDESKDTLVSDVVDEATVALNALAASTGIEPVPVDSAESDMSEFLVTQPSEEYVPTIEEEVEVSQEAESPVLDDVAMVEPSVVVEEALVELPAVTVTPNVVVVSEPVAMPAVVQTPTPAPVNAKPSLRDQLAALLGNQNQTAPTESPTTPAQSIVESVATVTIPEPSPQSVANSDDTDLYSINRFTI